MALTTTDKAKEVEATGEEALQKAKEGESLADQNVVEIRATATAVGTELKEKASKTKIAVRLPAITSILK
jgi:hypothetical protein